MIIDGKALSVVIVGKLRKEVEQLKKQGITPCFTVIQIGNNSESTAYIRRKAKKAYAVGILCNVLTLSENSTRRELISEIHQLATDPTVHGIIIQRPIPNHLSGAEIQQAVPDQKDIDGFNPTSVYDPPIGRTVISCLNWVKNQTHPKQQCKAFLKNQSIVILGRGLTGGGPVAKTLTRDGIAFHVLHSKSANPDTLIKNADIIITAVGKPDVFNPKQLKKGVVAINIGMYRGKDGTFHGDFDEKAFTDPTSYYTPTPGGTGPLTVAFLLSNAVEAAKKVLLPDNGS